MKWYPNKRMHVLIKVVLSNQRQLKTVYDTVRNIYLVLNRYSLLISYVSNPIVLNALVSALLVLNSLSFALNTKKLT